MYNYPYGNSQQLNLDWLIQQWRVFQSQIEGMIAPDYDGSVAYTAGSLVIVDHVLYTNPEAITIPENWNPAHWEPTTVAEILQG